MPSVLIVDDEPNIRRMVGALLASEGYEVRDAADGASSLARTAESAPDVVLLDLMMPGEMDGLATLARLREVVPDVPVIMMSGKAGLSDAVKATKLGAFNFLEKPLSPEGVLLALASALELRRVRREARALREDLGLAGEMIGGSQAMSKVREMIARIAPSDARVMVTGESGTGKELVAAAIHFGSARRTRPFVRVNCAAIPRDLVESEMFGHEKGAFTGATDRRIGRFELAHTGTLFLDEVGDLGLEAQAKLLRAIEAREIERVGGGKPIHVDVRIVSATNRDLPRAVAEGSFREDLFFRLNVIPIDIPPLHERPDDIPALVAHFSAMHRSRTGRRAPNWTPAALVLLAGHRWPGNIRELANIVERLAILHAGGDVDERHVAGVLPVAGGARRVEDPLPDPSALSQSLTDTLDAHERTLIVRALSAAAGNVADAARRLKTDRANLYRRIRRLGIPMSDE
ncbi:MAG: sigma-54 dependent transcriptional regulator [Gemmatimonadota bacterium]|nr:sigma-54 dependent transcriptional regulator [Gemmatimonadota bacterium]